MSRARQIQHRARSYRRQTPYTADAGVLPSRASKTEGVPKDLPQNTLRDRSPPQDSNDKDSIFYRTLKIQAGTHVLGELSYVSHLHLATFWNERSLRLGHFWQLCQKSLPTIFTASLGLLLGPVGTFSIFLTVSMPSITLPNTTCFPSKKSHLAVVMKN